MISQSRRIPNSFGQSNELQPLKQLLTPNALLGSNTGRKFTPQQQQSFRRVVPNLQFNKNGTISMKKNPGLADLYTILGYDPKNVSVTEQSQQVQNQPQSISPQQQQQSQQMPVNNIGMEQARNIMSQPAIGPQVQDMFAQRAPVATKKFKKTQRDLTNRIQQRQYGQYKLPFAQVGTFPLVTENATTPDVIAKINKDYFKPFETNDVIPTAYAAAQLQKQDQLQRYNNLYVQQFADKDNKIFKQWSQIVPQISYDQEAGSWAVKQYFGSRLHPAGNRSLANFAKSNELMNLKIGQKEMEQYVPTLVKQIVSANTSFSKSGIGPKSQGGLPFYTGRYIDKVTGRVRLLPKPSNKYINPLSYNAKKYYLQALILNKWNKYVQAAQTYTKFQKVRSQTYTEKQQKKLRKQLQNASKKINPRATIRFYLSEMFAAQLGQIIPKTSKLVLQTLKQYDYYQKFKDLCIKAKQTPTAQSIDQIYDNLLDILRSASRDIQAVYKQNTVQHIKKKQEYLFAFGVWIDKGKTQIHNLTNKVFKTLIPNNLTQKDIEKVKQSYNDWMSFQNKVDFKIQKLLDHDSFLRRASNIDQFTKMSKQLASKIQAKERYYKKDIKKYTPPAFKRSVPAQITQFTTLS